MDWPYIHIIINHFPIILTVVGSAALALALIVRRRGLWLYALATLTLAGASIYPAFYTGGRAAHALRGTWYVVHSMVEEHDAAATFALVAGLMIGVASAYTWWRMLRRDTTPIPPVWVRVVLALVVAWGLSVIVRTAYLGGLIVHESPKLRNPPTGAASVPGESLNPRRTGVAAPDRIPAADPVSSARSAG